MKMLLGAFEQLSGLKTNFHKSEVYCFGEAKNHNINTQNSLVAENGITRLGT
jgi:hypothetical protein